MVLRVAWPFDRYDYIFSAIVLFNCCILHCRHTKPSPECRPDTAQRGSLDQGVKAVRGVGSFWVFCLFVIFWQVSVVFVNSLS